LTNTDGPGITESKFMVKNAPRTNQSTITQQIEELYIKLHLICAAVEKLENKISKLEQINGP